MFPCICYNVLLNAESFWEVKITVHVVSSAKASWLIQFKTKLDEKRQIFLWEKLILLYSYRKCRSCHYINTWEGRHLVWCFLGFSNTTQLVITRWESFNTIKKMWYMFVVNSVVNDSDISSWTRYKDTQNVQVNK